MITTRRIVTALSLIGAAFILYIGISYLIAPEWIAPGFGLPVWPTGEAAAFSNLKGVRDTVTGIVVLVLLALGQRYALGVVLLGFALIPVGDMLTVLLHNGSAATAFGIHGLTAAFLALLGVLSIRERAGADTAAQTA
ncbi:DUF4267 domain-containing protein [Nocardia carnea]|uniref:DUF4267 domain-containing protein n=1 Tax=Nocardia carnea TaxID=37328 RepID=UPI002455A35D|nr:DUF4267 domain-containing protein [Nocardia carnea]